MNLATIQNFQPIPCIKVVQGFGDFYICSIKARELLRICRPIRAEDLDGEIENDPFDIGLLRPSGPQRKVAEKRPEQIADYIATGMAAFPNSIIIGANISEEGYLLDEEKWEWIVENNTLVIKDGARFAAIIDGQHRLQGYKLLSDKNHPRLDDELVCSVYLDLPITYHAQLFSMINSTQRRVNKNLIYQLYQIDMDEKHPKYWSPEVLSVYLARALGLDSKSPLKGRLVLAIDKDMIPLDGAWHVSLSSVVEGLLKLYSSKPLDDRDKFYARKIEEKTRDCLDSDGSAWRHLYLGNFDREIYENILHFLNIIYSFDKENDSAFRSSIGISAILEGLAVILQKYRGSYEHIKDVIEQKISTIDFSSLPKQKTTKNKKVLKDAIINVF